MALIKCPECQKEISDSVELCPNCGYPIHYEEQNSDKKRAVTTDSVVSQLLSFLSMNIHILKIITGILLIILGIQNLSTVLAVLFDLFDEVFNYGLFSLDLVIYFFELLSCICATIGFITTSIYLFKKRKSKYFECAPALVGISYAFTIFQSLIFCLAWFYLGTIVNLLVAIGNTAIWLLLISPDSIKIFNSNKMKSLVLTGCALILLIFRLNQYEVFGSGIFYYGSTLVLVILEYFSYISLVLIQYVENKLPKENVSTKILGKNDNVLNRRVLNNENGHAVIDSLLSEDSSTINNEFNGYVPVWKLILFSILTLNIYTYIWIYRTVGFFNNKKIGEEKSQTVQVVLCLFVPFYIIYWLYKQGKLTEEYTLKVGNTNNDLSIVSLVLSIFGLGLIAMALIQDQINKNVVIEQANPQVIISKPSDSKTKLFDKITDDDFDYLKKLKELYDMGILTEEEYLSKKEKIIR